MNDHGWSSDDACVRAVAPLRLRIPARVLGFVAAPVLFLGVWMAFSGGGLPALGVAAGVVVFCVVPAVRLGATIDAEAVRARMPVLRTRVVPWPEVDEFLVLNQPRSAPTIYLQTVTGEHIPVIGQPSRAYVKANYSRVRAFYSRHQGLDLVEHVIDDLRARHRAAARSGRL